MGKRQRAKNQKRARDLRTAYEKGEGPRPHKTSSAQSKRALKKKAYTA